jgi:hypothetical protein
MLRVYTQLPEENTEELWRALVVNLKLKILCFNVVICFIFNFLQHKFSVGTLYVNYLLYVSAFRPSSNMQIHCWLHCSLLHWQMFAVVISYVVDLICWVSCHHVRS